MRTISCLCQREMGYVSPLSVQRRIKYNITENLCFNTISTFEDPYKTDLQDLALCNNKLLAIQAGLLVNMYDVTDTSKSIYHVEGTWKSDVHHCYSGTETVEWNSNGDFFTVSGNTNKIVVVDAQNMKSIETIPFRGVRCIYQHRCNPYNNALLAVAANKEMSILDLRTGSVSSFGSHGSGSIMSVSWCPLEEFVCISCGFDIVRIWDVRCTKSSVAQLQLHSAPRGKSILPDVQFIPDSCKFVVLKVDQSVQVWDLNTLSLFGDINNTPSECPLYKYKFSITASCDPPLLFLPTNRQITLYNLNTCAKTNILSGHIMPVKLTIFDDKDCVLYSITSDCQSIIWLPYSLKQPL